MSEYTPAQQDEVRRQEWNMLEKINNPPTARWFREQALERCRRIRLARVAKVSGVGIFFVVNAKNWVHWIPWTENPSYAGFRTYGVGHPEFWKFLHQSNSVPNDMQYYEAARGRVNYHEASGTFTLFADRCIFKSKRQISAIMRKLNLPSNTQVLVDDQYQCLNCMRRRPPRLGLDEEWEY